MDYLNSDYVYATLWVVFSICFLRWSWRYWRRGDKHDAALDFLLAVLLLILAVLNFKNGMDS